MFQSNPSHLQYQNSVQQGLTKLYTSTKIKSILNYSDLIGKMFFTDLTQVRELMTPCYSQNPRGSIPRDPAAMMRSLLLMKQTEEHSITKWVQSLKNSDVYAILSGFDPDDVPGIGTFYDFIERLAVIDKDLENEKQKQPKEFKRKPKKKLKQNQKQPPKHPDIVNKMVNRVLKYEHHPPYLGQPQLVLDIFSQCFVLPSANKGLLGDTQNMAISGDGTLIKTGASPYGRKICDCKNKGIYQCDCKRIFSDHKARWGWDSYREIYVYGYNFFEIVACNSPYDLPIFFIQTQAQRHDSVSSLVAVDKIIKLYPQFKFSKFLGDSAMDNYGFYKLLNHHHIEPFIALNETRLGQFIYQKLHINDNGIPICPGRWELVHFGFCPDRMRHKWRCPSKALKSFLTENEKICKTFDYCSPSNYGRTFYTYQKDNLRLFTKTPRNSAQWKNTFKRRTASERSNKRKKIDYHLEQDRVRSHYQWMIRYALTAMCQHIDAWYDIAKQQFIDLCKAWEKQNAT
ncbi:MAG: hypothetical protein JSW07_00130 [bacterium]|nr:MAG: hypothetical protein JSW07_00130 [bacterium]